MIELSDELLSPDLLQQIKNLQVEVDEFRETSMDKIAVEKLREHFRTHHIFHSSGIEGNRLTLQETSIVLKEGIDISGKPLKDSLEVKNLGIAFDFLYKIVKDDVEITEHHLKQIHSLIIGNEESLNPGNYREIGVIISGSEHRPPEPFEVPIKMRELFDWIHENAAENPLIVGAIAHHEMVKIHPFKDGNGRTARLLLNLILLKNGFPICNIRRDERPDYYNALSLADEGEYEPIIEVVTKNCTTLFAEYVRIKDESNRLKDWAKRIGTKDTQQRLAKSKAEFELWLNKVNQIKLEFKQVVSVIDQNVESFYVSFYEYPLITFEKYQQLKETGMAPNTNFFSVRFHNNDTNKILSTLMFRFFRSGNKYPKTSNVIPLELNYFDEKSKEFNFIGYSEYSKHILLRAFYVADNGEIIIRYAHSNEENPNWEKDHNDLKLANVVQSFFENVFASILGVE
ncbi:Fic family protein [Aquimarina sp. ERC-38]|uniref:Fic family protein n=1 Tax=Aquimarina sp. ERC-38 TaxID=2949996 RepID=UPI002246253D|nr:Fic family protein [Aquimarina sp. ERC-38]UZO81163.1 Fic family protein [Aquimarina sp. ERC-38]